MRYDPERHHRRSIRLKDYDYTRMGAYFVTLCTRNRTCLFGEIVAGEMRLNEYGEVVAESWRWLATQYDYVELDEWVVMPNHLHGIIVITGGDRKGFGGTDGSDGRGGDDVADGSHGRGGSRTAPTIAPTAAPTVIAPTTPTTPTVPAGKRKPLGRLIGAFKTVSTKRVNDHRGTPGATVWQRNYYEHIIRHEESLNRIRAYILNNPLQWHLDHEHALATDAPPWADEWFG